MKWPEFLAAKETYQEVWKNLKGDYDGDIRKFLNRSYVEIFYGGYRQMPFDSNYPASVAISNPDFFVKDKVSRPLLELAEEHRAAKKKKDDEALDGILKEMEKIAPNDLSVVDFRVEIIFPTIAIESIQKIKQSKWSDQEQVNMSRASIRVVLLKKPVTNKSER